MTCAHCTYASCGKRWRGWCDHICSFAPSPPVVPPKCPCASWLGPAHGTRSRWRGCSCCPLRGTWWCTTPFCLQFCGCVASSVAAFVCTHVSSLSHSLPLLPCPFPVPAHILNLRCNVNDPSTSPFWHTHSQPHTHNDEHHHHNNNNNSSSSWGWLYHDPSPNPQLLVRASSNNAARSSASGGLGAMFRTRRWGNAPSTSAGTSLCEKPMALRPSGTPRRCM